MFKLDPQNPIFAEDIFEKYTQSFVHKKNFENRALIKFVNQTKANMFDLFCFLMPSLTSKRRKKALDFYDIPTHFLMDILSLYIDEENLNDFKVSDKFKEICIKHIHYCRETAEKNIKIKQNDEDLENMTAFALFTDFFVFGEAYTSKEALTLFLYLNGIFKTKKLPIRASIKDIIDILLSVTAKEYLMSKSISEKDLRENNILEYIPIYPHDLLEFYKRFFLYFLINIDRIGSILAITKNMQEYYTESNEQFFQTFDDLKKERDKALNEAQEAKREKANLESKLKEVTSSADRNTENIKIKNSELNREIKAKTKEIESLKQQIHKIKTEQKKEKKIVPVVEQPVYKEINFDGHYLFVLYEDCLFIPDLKKTFPNMIYTGGNMNLENYCLDAIVVFTGHISHSGYLPIKQQAKTKNIPIIYCPSTNIDKIKKMIFDEIG